LIDAFRTDNNINEHMPIIDFKHPKNPKRSILKDFYKHIQKLQKESELIGRGTENTTIIDQPKALSKINKLKKEYFNVNTKTKLTI
jgi:hypothetical protein